MTDQDKLSINFTARNHKYPISFDKQTCISCLNFKAPDFEDEKRAPIDLVAVVDVSGSMTTDLPLVKDTLLFMVSQFKATDRFALISFGTNVNHLLPLTTMDQNGKEIAIEVVTNKLVIAGSTYLSGGLLDGVRMLRTREAPYNEVASVLLFTDGRSNKGIKDPEDLVEAISNPYFEPRSDINPPKGRHVKNKKVEIVEDNKKKENVVIRDCPFTIYTFGYQQSHNAELLRRVAEFSKSGVYFYIENKDSIAESFADCIGGLLSVIGQNITITVKALGDIEFKILNELQIVEKVPKKEYVINYGDIQSEESKDIICELEVPSIDFRYDNYNLLEWKIEYFNVITLVQKEELLVSTIGREYAPSTETNFEVENQVNRILAIKALKEAEEARQKGESEKSKRILEETKQKIETSKTGQDTYSHQLISDLNQGVTELNSGGDRSYYYMQNVYDMHNKQRSNNKSNTTYITGKKNKAKFESDNYMKEKKNN